VLLVSARTTMKTVVFDKKEYRLFSFDDDFQRCFIGIPLDLKPGKYSIKCGKETTEFLVINDTAPSEAITISGMGKIDEKLAQEQHRKMLKSIAGISEKKLWSGRFIRPVEGRVTTDFGTKRTVNKQTKGWHKGVDLASNTGVPIKTPAGGKVLMAEELIGSGNSVVVDHGLGIVSVYFHMSSIKAKPGQVVRPGDTLGLVGSTGFSTGPHLHWGVYVFGTSVDPFIFMKSDYFIGLRKK